MFKVLITGKLRIEDTVEADDPLIAEEIVQYKMDSGYYDIDQTRYSDINFKLVPTKKQGRNR